MVTMEKVGSVGSLRSEHLSFSVCAGECGTVCKVLSGAGEPISLRHRPPACLHHSVDATLAVCPLEVWQEDSLLCWHVDPHAHTAPDSICTIPALLHVPSGCSRGTGCLLCIPVAMVSVGCHSEHELLYNDQMCVAMVSMSCYGEYGYHVKHGLPWRACVAMVTSYKQGSTVLSS